MARLTNSITIAAPADQVWEVVAGRFDAIGEWATAIPASAACSVPQPVAGAPVPGRVCHTGIALVPEVTETVVGYDAAARTLTYEATAGMPAFVTLARNRWQVTAESDQRARVAFVAELQVRGPLGGLARWWLLTQAGRTGRHLLEDLKHFVEHGTPSPRKQRQLGRAETVDPVAAVGDGQHGIAVGVWPTTRRLRAALRVNAVFSLLCGVALLAGGGFVAAAWGWGPAWLPPALGVGLVGFGVGVARLAVLPAAGLRGWAALVVAADAVWVVASVVALVVSTMARPGSVVVVAVAAAVAAVAVWQGTGLAAIRGEDRLGDVEVVESTRVFAQPAGRVWPLLTDHDLYGRLAPNLRSVEVISDADAPLRRRCTNTAGHGWEEICTLWEDGRRFAVEVDTTVYPYPIALMRGLWQVDPHPSGSQVTMRFTYRVRPTIWGGAFAIAFRPLFRPVLRRIFDGWQSRLSAGTDPAARAHSHR